MSTQIAGKKRILIVDDERSVLEAARMSLEDPKYLILTADNPLEALEIIQQSGIDLVVTDYAMPEMKGDEFTTRVREMIPSCPVVMMTAYAEMLGSRVLNQVSVLLSKPFFPSQLRDAVEKSFATPPSR